MPSASASRFVEGVHGFAPDARWVQARIAACHPEVHRRAARDAVDRNRTRVTKRALEYNGDSISRIRILSDREIRTRILDRHGGRAATRCAGLAIDEKTATLGIPKEDRAFSPHLTLARGRGGSGSPRWRRDDGPNPRFSDLQEKLASLPSPEFGTMTPREFFLYQSQLSPKGSKYTKLAAFASTVAPAPPRRLSRGLTAAQCVNE